MSKTNEHVHHDHALIRAARAKTHQLGDYLVEAFELLALFVIGGTIVWAAVGEYLDMMQDGHATLDGILLLFIYLELGAMVGIYFRTSRIPVQFLLYIAITVMTRFLAVDVKELSDRKIFVITGSILVLTLAILVLRIGESQFRGGRDV